MTYYQAIQEIKKRKYSNGWIGILITIFLWLLILTSPNVGFNFRYLICIAIGLYVFATLVFDKVLTVDVRELLKIDVADDKIIVARNGASVFEASIHDIRRAWFEPRFLLKRKLVLEFDNYNQHSIKFPFLAKTVVNDLKSFVALLNVSKNNTASRST